jgi:predicted metalloenzyme YecM
MSDHTSDVDRFKLDPAKFPKRIDVFVSERVVDHIQAISARSERSFSESAVAILAERLEDGVQNY